MPIHKDMTYLNQIIHIIFWSRATQQKTINSRWYQFIPKELPSRDNRLLTNQHIIERSDRKLALGVWKPESFVFLFSRKKNFIQHSNKRSHGLNFIVEQIPTKIKYPLIGKNNQQWLYLRINIKYNHCCVFISIIAIISILIFWFVSNEIFVFLWMLDLVSLLRLGLLDQSQLMFVVVFTWTGENKKGKKGEKGEIDANQRGPIGWNVQH